MIARMAAFFQVDHDYIPGHGIPASIATFTNTDAVRCWFSFETRKRYRSSGESCIQCGRDDSPKD